MNKTVTIDTQAPILVTGASGYVAGWLVKRLLEAGATVHGTVRDAQNTAKTAPLLALADGTPGTLNLFSADLLTDGSFDEAMAGCNVVFHTASPFTLDTQSDAQETFVTPAVNGTRNVLEAANRTASVTRVVVTSSCAAIYGDAIDYKLTPNGRFTEDVWNTTSGLDYGGYSYSKTAAEQEAWKIAEAQDRWRLTTINPSLVMGPAVTGDTSSGSFDTLRMLGGGDLKWGAPRFGIGLVDVRDVAEAHIRAAFMDGAKGRHITSAHNTNLVEMGLALRKRFSDYPLPKMAMPKLIFWLLGPIMGIPRKYIAGNVDIEMKIDNTKSREQLGMVYRPMDETLNDMFEFAIAHGVLKN